ncbi:hypothetical protein ILUMI_05026 [Ignelater luminosus]|uniref:Peptidase S1 domain-containing protein n=1 Tax=Ignelater luminosus TaxID=2038154 RepID=A0A8K0DIH5_IGNLU|nr:hypothetical protein ILUMI_05026 [Ignelater luminosus]
MRLKDLLYYIFIFVKLNFCYDYALNVYKAQEGQYPFLARLQMELQWPDSENKTYCGASLITLRNILTAASCFAHVDPRSIQQLCNNRKLVVYVGKKLFRFRMPDSDRSRSPSVGYLEYIIPHKKYQHDKGYDIAVGRLIDFFKYDHKLIRPIMLPRYVSGNIDSKLCQLGDVVGTGKATADHFDLMISVVYMTGVKTTLHDNRLSIYLPEIGQFIKGKSRDNLGGPFVCYHKTSIPVQYGIIKSREIVLVERMMDFIELWVREYTTENGVHWRTNRSEDATIGKTSGLAKIEKATVSILLWLVALLIVN